MNNESNDDLIVALGESFMAMESMNERVQSPYALT
jgi:hypothetical protein